MLLSGTHDEGREARHTAKPRRFECADTITVRAKCEISALSAQRPFLLVSGWAFQQHIARDGERQILALMLPGEAFLGLSRYSIAAATECVVEFPVMSSWDQFRDTYSAVSGGIDDLHTVQRWLTAIGRNKASKRIAYFLCDLARRLAHGGSEALLAFELPITQHDIADMCCLTSVHVNRVIRLLEHSGLIHREPKWVLIKDYDRLARLAEI